MKTKNTLYYTIVIAIVLIAKLAYIYATNNSLQFILKPISGLIELATGLNFQYEKDFGFYFKDLNIAIDKSCSGINFWLISFVVFSFSFLKFSSTTLQKIIALPIVILATYLLTLFANTSRILTSIAIEKQMAFNYSWVHQAEGVFIYLSILIIAYISLNRFISKFIFQNEKFA